METKHASPGLQKLIRSLVETIAHECEVKALLGDTIREIVTPIVQQCLKDLFPYAVVVVAAVFLLCVFTVICLVILLMR